MSYVAFPCIEVFLEPVAVGDSLPEMPLFLTPELYILLPLDATYRSAWEAFPASGKRSSPPPHSPLPGTGNPGVVDVEDADILTRVPSELSHRLGPEMVAGIVVLFLDGASALAERRRQTQSGRRPLLPGGRAIWLISADALSDRRLLSRGHRHVGTECPVRRPVDRPRAHPGLGSRVTGLASRQTPPSPILGTRRQPGPHRVSLRVSADGEQMIVRLHGEGIETTLVKVTRTDGVVMGVPALGVSQGQPLHELGEVAIAAVPMRNRPVRSDHACGDSEQTRTVCVKLAGRYRTVGSTRPEFQGEIDPSR